jgi:type IV secretory pathway TraG/TraD family ATPase VirD4
MHTGLTYLGRVNWRDNDRPFGIWPQDRLAHLYAVGKTGTGKSTFLEFLIRQDLVNGSGLALFDPHGDLVERVREFAVRKGRKDVVYLNVPDLTQRFGFNPLANVAPERRSLAAAGLIEAFKKMFDDSWGVKLEHFFRHALLLLLDQPSATLADVPRLFFDDQFRKQATGYATLPQVRRFWTFEFPNYPPRFRTEAVAPIMNKVGAFLADPFLDRILASRESTFDLRKIMDEGHVLLVNLAKGRIGEGPAALFGALLMSSLSLAGLSRSDAAEDKRSDFFIYGDEFQTYTTLAIANMLAELRKYGVGIILANQYLDQLENEVRSAILGNIGTLVVFRVGASDGAALGKELGDNFETQDLIALPNRNFFVRMLVRGQYIDPFSAKTIEVPGPP